MADITEKMSLVCVVKKGRSNKKNIPKNGDTFTLFYQEYQVVFYPESRKRPLARVATTWEQQ